MKKTVKKCFSLTWSSCFTSDVSHSSSSLCRVDTSSTEHFFAATFATLSSSRRASERVLEQPSVSKSRSSFLAHGSFATSLIPSIVPHRRRGVLHALEVKSIRTKRTASLVNCSRQKGQTGVRRGDVFSTIVLQQFAHSTCPTQESSH